MFTKDHGVVGVRVVLILFLLAGVMGISPVQASAGIAGETSIQQQTQDDCEPNTGWMWTNGPTEPEVAAQVQKKLREKGIDAIVEARGYGETDSCGTYKHHGMDFKVTLSDKVSKTQYSQQAFVENIFPVLVELGEPNLGNVKLISPLGDVIPVEIPTAQLSTSSTSDDALASATAVTKKVYVIVYDPLLSNGQTLSGYLQWNDHAPITQQTIDFFTQSSNGEMNYTVVDTTVVTSGWPELIDGFSYTEQEFLAVWANPSLHHVPTGVNYNKIVNSPEFDICGKVNRGEIDEVWIYNGPWFGFYESTLVGPGAYPMNSSPVSGSHNCNKIVPIMGPSVERTAQEAVHNFTHRTEDTMKKVYGSWQQNRTAHSWDKFALVKAQSPNYSYSGCGSSHYPPNAVADYDYGNLSSVLSNCDDFANYPNLSDPLQVAQPVTCSTWGCTQLDYFRYWFGHFPAFDGCGPDNVANDWWKYISTPGIALYPSYACQADMRLISGNVGASGVTLTYTDGVTRNVVADGYGNYFLMVSNHWSGTVTPSRAGYTFSPASREYTDVQSDVSLQNYTSQAPVYFVNAATGNDGNTCTSVAAPCRNIYEAINKASAGDTVYVASGTYLRSTTSSPNVVIIGKSIRLSGGWNSDFTLQDGASTIDGANANNGILVTAGTVTVENFVIQNSISYNSGAIYIVNGNFTLNRSTLRNNRANVNGAGIFVDNGVVNIVNSTISENQAGSSGGGIYASNNSGGSVNIQNSTIAYNTASTGGGISRTNGAYTVTNTIIAKNTASSSSPDCYGTLAAANFNIIENMAGCTIASGSSNLNVDPQIEANSSASLLVYMPLQGSPAIDAGTASGCPSTDQLGSERPQGGGCDIGSMEYFGQMGDITPPTVLSVTRANPSPTLAASVDFNVTFSEPVTGVDVSDFVLSTSGVSGAAVNAVNGSGDVYTVTVGTGTGSGTIRLDLVDDDSILDAASNPLGGSGPANGDFTQGEAYTVPQILTLNLNSTAANDGWVLESSENSNIGGSLNATANTFDVGDDKANKQYVGILHFSTSSLPDTAVITSVTLKVRKQGTSGTDPFTTHGGLLVDIQQPYFGTAATLTASDFQAAAGASAVSTFSSSPVNSWYSAIVDGAGYIYINLTGTTQFRLRFTLDDDNDKRADSVKFYSGNASTAYRPQLIVQYYVP